MGYRKMTASAHGAWLARSRDENTGPKQVFKTLGEFENIADHLRFDAATKAALAWFEHLGRGGTVTVATVAEASSRYVQHLKATKTAGRQRC